MSKQRKELMIIIQHSTSLVATKLILLTDDDFPILDCIRNFIHRSHFRIRNSTHYENNDTGNILHTLLIVFLIAPMSVSRTV